MQVTPLDLIQTERQGHRNSANALGGEALAGLEARLTKHKGYTPKPPRHIKAEIGVRKAIKAFKRGEYRDSVQHALEALKYDDAFAPAYHSVALGLEKLNELHKSLQFFEKALALDPQDPELYYNLANTAWRLNMTDAALRLFRIYIDMEPDEARGHNNLASLLRDMGHYEDALETARAAIYRIPEDAYLWNTVGTILVERGDIDQAEPFYAEALRLNPRFGLARHNIAHAHYLTGNFPQALEDWRLALKTMGTDFQRPEAEHGVAQALLALGQLEAGFRQWDCRHDPSFRGSTLFNFPAPKWDGEPLAGKRILIAGEQGVGDEVMFANAVGDVIEQVGPEGLVILAVEHRLVPLFARSFPRTTVRAISGQRHNGKILRFAPWVREHLPLDYYAPMGDTLKFLRRTLGDFPADRPLLTADPKRVRFWRARLEELGPGPYIGVCWRSGLMTAMRTKFYCPLDEWKRLFASHGPKWINLQYDECNSELEVVGQSFGAAITQFKDLDLKHNLDDNAALCSALDLVISAPTAAAALSGAVGTKTWILSNAPVWMSLGTGHYPWYTDTQFFAPKAYADWPDLMATLSGRLDTFLAGAQADAA